MNEVVAEITALLALDGYEPVPRLRGDAQIDREMAAQMVCGPCGSAGHELLAFERSGAYRAVVICRACKTVDDF